MPANFRCNRRAARPNLRIVSLQKDLEDCASSREDVVKVKQALMSSAFSHLDVSMGGSGFNCSEQGLENGWHGDSTKEYMVQKTIQRHGE